MGLFADLLWPLVGLTAVLLVALLVASLVRPAVRRNKHFRIALRVVGVLAVVELALILVYFFVLMIDMPPIGDL